MSYLYFDESIRERGQFIVGALVKSDHNLTLSIRDHWSGMGLNPTMDEYKSSALKQNNSVSRAQRTFLRGLLQRSGLALTVAPADARTQLGNYCTELILQLSDAGLLSDENHALFVDENIKVCQRDRTRLRDAGVTCNLNTDSSEEAGIQLADHAAHSLGGMLLEEMGIVKKQVRVGENSGYDPEMRVELGFELWASLRYALIGKNEHIEGLSPPPDDPANPFFRVDRYGLYIAPTCPEGLREHARSRFGVNYLGCIH